MTLVWGRAVSPAGVVRYKARPIRSRSSSVRAFSRWLMLIAAARSRPGSSAQASS